MEDAPQRHEHWTPAYRVVSSRFPPVTLFDRVTDPADLEAVQDLEGLTNPRLRDEIGDITLVPQSERVVGHGSTPIMAAFTHRPADGSRFTDGSFGVYYCATSTATAIRETVYHRERFMRRSDEPPQMLEMRLYEAELIADLIDIEGAPDVAALCDPHSYTAAQAFGLEARQSGEDGIRYPSVRDPEGVCAAVFRPRCLVPPAIQTQHYGYHWDGQTITDVIKLSESGVQPHPGDG
ncbi:RES domain-containing protein [Spiribacter vilamensis]|nr:RES domain-containing protein [Spiribacter vilamensis]